MSGCLRVFYGQHSTVGKTVSGAFRKFGILLAVALCGGAVVAGEDSGAAAMRRLSAVQYRQVIADTFGPSINHAANKQQVNCEFVHTKYIKEAAEPELVYIKATRDIAPGDELFLDYGKQYWNDHNQHCSVCFKLCTDDDDPLVKCDGIDHANPCCLRFHTSCAGLSSIPTGTFYCSLCIARETTNEHQRTHVPNGVMAVTTASPQ